MGANPLAQLGRRERQIMDAAIRLGRASVSDVRAELPDPPSYSAVRGMLRLLTEKGYLRYEQDGPRYLYMPAMDVAAARRTALSDVVDTFFEGSMEATVSALLGEREGTLEPAALDRLAALIEEARNREANQ